MNKCGGFSVHEMLKVTGKGESFVFPKGELENFHTIHASVKRYARLVKKEVSVEWVKLHSKKGERSGVLVTVLRENVNRYDLNEYLMNLRSFRGHDHDHEGLRKRASIRCNTGLIIDIQAGSEYDCSPNTEIGPWKTVECSLICGEAPALDPYRDSHATSSRYCFVPIELAEEVIRINGGFAPKGE